MRGRDAHSAPQNLTDGNADTYWATDDSVTTPDVTLDFRDAVTFNVVRLRKFLPLGQRVEAIALDQWQDGRWLEFGRATNIGSCRLSRTIAPTDPQTVLDNSNLAP